KSFSPFFPKTYFPPFSPKPSSPPCCSNLHLPLAPTSGHILHILSELAKNDDNILNIASDLLDDNTDNVWEPPQITTTCKILSIAGSGGYGMDEIDKILYTVDKVLLGNRWLRKATGIQPKFPYVVKETGEALYVGGWKDMHCKKGKWIKDNAADAWEKHDKEYNSSLSCLGGDEMAVDQIDCLKKTLGSRRSHIRGVGRVLKSVTPNLFPIENRDEEEEHWQKQERAMEALRHDNASLRAQIKFSSYFLVCQLNLMKKMVKKTNLFKRIWFYFG
ncbi:hypothetical protein M8C21_002549, partial [Ambrosia artemisiifolia]